MSVIAEIDHPPYLGLLRLENQDLPLLEVKVAHGGA